MAITSVHECDFVVWTTKDISIETITFDSGFWNQSCLPKLKHFFFYYMFPELIYKKHPAPHDYSCYTSNMYVDI